MRHTEGHTALSRQHNNNVPCGHYYRISLRARKALRRCVGSRCLSLFFACGVRCLLAFGCGFEASDSCRRGAICFGAVLRCTARMCLPSCQHRCNARHWLGGDAFCSQLRDRDSWPATATPSRGNIFLLVNPTVVYAERGTGDRGPRADLQGICRIIVGTITMGGRSVALLLIGRTSWLRSVVLPGTAWVFIADFSAPDRGRGRRSGSRSPS